MNRVDAHELLDALRAGIPATDAEIAEALRATGDLPSFDSQRRQWQLTCESVLLPSQTRTGAMA